MIDSDQKSKRISLFANLSLLCIIITVLSASFTHAYELGPGVVTGFSVIAVLLILLNITGRIFKSKTIYFVYGFLNVLIILGLGILNGFWNHSFKLLLTYLHNGYLPPAFAILFMNPKTGDFFYEGAGVLTFIAGISAAYFLY